MIDTVNSRRTRTIRLGDTRAFIEEFKDNILFKRPQPSPVNKELGMDPVASIIMAAALLFYSIGVWAERIQGRLKPWHLVFFVLGLICDTWGTGLMFDYVGGLTFDVHGISGLIAIILMLIHAIWAAVVLIRKDERMIINFHKFSIAVWLIWLIPYFSPMFFALEM